jgi:hypothetical protein
MRRRIVCIDLMKRTEFAGPSAATFCLLMWIMASGCGTAKKPAVVPPRTVSGPSASEDANGPGPYFHVDSGMMLTDINTAFREKGFTKEALGDHWRLRLLGDICCRTVEFALCPDWPVSLMGSTHVPSADMRPDPWEWLKDEDRNEPNKAKVASLIRRPEFVFKGGNWNIVMNVFTRDGRVEQCMLAGDTDPRTNLLQVKRVDVTHLKPPGTYKWTRIP